MRATIPDDLYDAIGDDTSLAVLLTEALPLRDPHTLLVTATDRATLAALLGGLPIRTSADLVAKVATLADLRVGKIHVPLTPAQWAAIDAKATRQGKTRDQYVRQMLDQFLVEWTEIAVRT